MIKVTRVIKKKLESRTRVNDDIIWFLFASNLKVSVGNRQKSNYKISRNTIIYFDFDHYVPQYQT